jgi:hypothetical protein
MLKERSQTRCGKGGMEGGEVGGGARGGVIEVGERVISVLNDYGRNVGYSEGMQAAVLRIASGVGGGGGVRGAGEVLRSCCFGSVVKGQAARRRGVRVLDLCPGSFD